MTDSPVREHFIPLQVEELAELLCSDATLSDEDREGFRRLCRLLAAIYHFEYHQTLKRLKTAYAPFDPDADIKSLTRLSEDQKQHKLNALFQEFTRLMERADFRHLSLQELEPALESASYWGFRTSVNFRVFERLAIFARGDAVETRLRRRLRHRWRGEVCELPIYQRLVMILKLRPVRRLHLPVDTDCVYLQVFKNIPKLDVKMLLPGARARLTLLDRSKIGFPLLSGLTIAVAKILQGVVATFTSLFDFSLLPNSLAAWTFATGTVGYGIRSYFGWQQTKQRYNADLARMLYFQNLDTNAGVLYRVLDEAEEQDCREAMLAYYYLWRYAGAEGWTSADLVRYIETDLEKHCQVRVDFEIAAAIAKLERLQLVTKAGARHRAQPLEQALPRLAALGDGYFAGSSAERSGTSPRVPESMARSGKTC